MAILGATGSGKSSIMNILARRLAMTSRMSVSGTVRLNGAPRDRRWKSSFCEQNDLFLATLTVEETLLFSARLRMPSTSTPQSRQARVDAVLRTLGLGKVAHTKVGGDLVRGISGGEAKRLALGVEMVVNPPLLFMDEPTSGLDAFNAQSLMATLSTLTTTGRTIVVCIHQPRSGITAMFDALLLLSEGRVMWSGKAGDQPVAFLEGLGFRLPAHTNPSDYFLDVVSIAFNTADTERVTRERVDMIAAAYKERQHEALAQLRDSAPAYGKDQGGATQQQPLSAMSHRPWHVEFGALLFRAGRLKGRQNLENGINLVRTTVFSLLLGLIWLHVAKRAARSGNPAEIRNTGGLLFFSIVNHSFSGVFGVVFTFASESRLVLRERIAGAYRVSSYYVTYLAVELPRVAVWSLLHSVVIYWLAGLRPSARAFLTFYAIHILVELNAEAITLLFTAATRSEKIASAVAPIPLVISILFGAWEQG
jgi:ABC-type multidrug transport system ATPase subunit